MDKSKTKRSTVERRKKILNLLDINGQVFVHELSEQFNVSEVTIRNDLELFESKKLLIRARGGAMKYDNSVSADYQLSEKDKIHYAEKIEIGKKAASLIKEGETIILDSGTTTMEVAKHLDAEKAINVITNAFNIANQLIHAQNINIIVPGGTLRKNSHSLVGPLAEKNLRNFYVDKVFLGVDGLDIKQGAFTPNIEEASLNQIMIDIAKDVILVADSSKFNRRSLAFICPTNKINIIVTDANISKEVLVQLQDANIKVIIA
ncbi:DeoR/GlpR transcriptional regulator [Maribacter polysiphoniae]|uniref:DeoR family transcriptional regulator n=1 Tax=Maribacter polysiphoniae TaxID=429344 RepID=A0A316DZW4_9FLAO|nr:transcriptional repressor AgaR [Maribacter polysiphoniae]MBD1261435.1 DeoR/GlpR transcriptional regulator [Maribacter polysiphoniae]PWK22769.1 DeoR family transcriptional regulator [Maribacter polysiphoniae]